MKAPDGPRRVEGFCALCRSRCGARFVVEQGRLAAAEPWPGHPTGGALCAKGRAAPELQHHPERLTRPLKRTRPKSDPDPGWVEVGWDEALDDIADRLNQIRARSGAESVAFASASPGATALSDSLEWIERLIFAFGSPNFLTGVEICNWHRDHGHAHTFGHGIGMPDYAQTELVLLWGFTPGNVWLAQAQQLAAARARGARVVVIDPVATRHAQGADLWLRVRPGTDAQLALGLARLLVTTSGFDDDFVRRWTNAPFLIREDTGQPLTERDLDPGAAQDRPLAWHAGRGVAVPLDPRPLLRDDLQDERRDDLSDDLPSREAAALALHGTYLVGGFACRTAFDHYAAACEPWTPEAVEAATGVPAGQVEQLARWLAASRKTSYFSWTGIAQHANATQTDRAIALLYALTGCVDAPGGNRQYARLPVNPANDRALLPPEQAAKALGLRERPLGPPAFGWILGADFCRAALEGEPYRVRALVGFGANLVMSQPDSVRMDQALQALDFQVHVDQFETPTGRRADYLLPASTPWEREGLRIGFEIDPRALGSVQLRPRVVSPAEGHEARPDVDIVFDLARRLGHGELFFDGDVERGWNHQLEPLGIDVAALRAAPGGLLELPLEQRARAHAQPRADGRARGFATPSGRIEVYATRLAAHGIAPVPLAMDPRAPFSADALPLLLGCAKSGYYCQSQHRGAASLRLREPEPWAALHPTLAAARGIAAGDAFEVVTRQGRARFVARFDERLAPDSVLASFGWWQGCPDLGIAPQDPLAAGHANMNAIVDASVHDGPSGSTPLRAHPCDVRALPDAAGWNGWMPARLTRIANPVADVLELAVTRADGQPLPPWQAGQHLRIAFDALDASSPPERCYSLIGAVPVGPAPAYRVAVRVGEAGGVAATLAQRFAAEPGATIDVRIVRPAGRFLLPIRPARPVVLMAAGIGITPFLGLIETWAEWVGPADSPGANAARAMPPLWLLYGNRDGAHHAYRERLAALAARLPTLRIVDHYSQPRAHDCPDHVGRVDADGVPQQVIDAGARFYLCGPPAMLTAIRAGLVRRGVPRHAIFSESFAAPEPDGVGTGPHTVRFARSGRVATWTGQDRNLLAFGERMGIRLAGGCRVGQCESCRLDVLAGAVRHAAETEVAAEGACLACMAVPTSDLELDA